MLNVYTVVDQSGYEQDALRTLPAKHQYRTDLVSSAQLFSTIHNAIVALQELDAVKKSFAYGKELVLDFEYGDQEVPVYLGNIDLDILHGVLGIATEAGELLEAVALSIFDDEAFDMVNLKEELGDVFWYAAILSVRSDTNFTEIQTTNINKLKARYPDKFTSEDAINRDLDAERKVLEA